MAHPTGSFASIHRTLKLSGKFDDAISGDGKLTLDDGDYNYVKSSLIKADKWNNSLEIAKSLAPVFNAISTAQTVE